MYPNALYQGGDITIMGASLPHLRHFSLVVRRRSGTSTKNAAYLVKTLTSDAVLETLNLQCDYKGWETPTIYRAVKRHSKTLRVLCAPGWYAHTAMLQALDKFIVLEEVTVGRILHLEVRQLPLHTSCHPYSQVDVLKDFKRIQKVYLYNHQHSLPLSTGEVKMLLLQSESSIHTFGESAFADKDPRFINIWRARRCFCCCQLWDVYTAYSDSLDIRFKPRTTTEEHRSGYANGTRECGYPIIAPIFIFCCPVCTLDRLHLGPYPLRVLIAQALKSANYSNPQKCPSLFRVM